MCSFATASRGRACGFGGGGGALEIDRLGFVRSREVERDAVRFLVRSRETERFFMPSRETERFFLERSPRGRSRDVAVLGDDMSLE
mmetsp:Transcript_10020/g.18012  ORF Transcript_10020/g.18012 Transcript_10020/m.18012 type:complete len:86 (+) Transcript_10020:195-452(+)